MSIPAMVSQNTEITAAAETLAKKLQTGVDFPLEILPSGKKGRHWQLKDPANALAARPVEEIEFNRQWTWCYRVHWWLDDALKLEPFGPATWRTWAELGWRILAEISPDGKPENHPFFRDPKTRICKVRKSRKQSFPKKQKPKRRLDGSRSRAERLLNFLAALPDEIYPVLDSPSIAEGDIKEALFGAFELIATGESRRTRQRRKAAPTKG